LRAEKVEVVSRTYDRTELKNVRKFVTICKFPVAIEDINARLRVYPSVSGL
jgi:hypothetical protein